MLLSWRVAPSTATNDMKSGMSEILRKLRDVLVIKTFQVKERVLGAFGFHQSRHLGRLMSRPKCIGTGIKLESCS